MLESDSRQARASSGTATRGAAFPASASPASVFLSFPPRLDLGMGTKVEVVRKRKTLPLTEGGRQTDSGLFQQRRPLQPARRTCLRSPRCLHVQIARNKQVRVGKGFFQLETALRCFITRSGGCNIPGQRGLSNTSNFLTAQEAGSW